MEGSGAVLVLNAGSSSIKFAVFSAALSELISGAVDRIGPEATLKIAGRTVTAPLADHSQALEAIFQSLEDEDFPITGYAAIAHRVVHGGTRLTNPMRVTQDVRTEIENCIPLAPLHNPHNLAAIEHICIHHPDIPQFVTFDTGFHATNPAVATHYAIPQKYTDQGIQRYGFHGTSYAALLDALPALTSGRVPDKLLAFHLGNGASICAIKQGISVATTMGYSPIDGLTMGTRCGSIDANAVLRIAEDIGIDAAKSVLNKDSGLLGLSGISADMRELEAANADFAISHFCYWAIRHAGSLIAAMGGLDAIVFTGGIGENARAVRQEIISGLSWLGADIHPQANAANANMLHSETSRISIYRIPAAEERLIAKNALDLLLAAPT